MLDGSKRDREGTLSANWDWGKPQLSRRPVETEDAMVTRRPLLMFFTASLLAGTLGSSSFARQEEQAPAEPEVKKPNATTPREIVYPYYSLREKYQSTLVLMDRAPRSIQFRIAIHSQSGRTVWSKPMTIQPQERPEISLAKLLDDLHVDYRGDFEQGSLSIHFKGPGNPMGGRLMVEGPDEELNIGPVWKEDEAGYGMIPKELDSLWWDLGEDGRDARIVVTNTSSDPVTADLYLDFQGKRHPAAPLKFDPHASREISVKEALEALGVAAQRVPAGGISIVPRDGKAVLAAQGKMTDFRHGYSTTMDFPLPQLQSTNALHASGVPIGPPSADSPFADQGSSIPHVIVRNLLDSEQTVTLTIEYPGKTQPQRTALEPLRLPAYTTQDISLDAHFSELPLPLPFCSIRIQHNGPPGSMMAKVLSDDTENSELDDVRVANEGNGYAGSLASYWEIGDDTDTVVFLTNMGDKDCRVGFRVETGGVTYFLTNLRLVPHETRYVSLRDLRDKQQPDLQGTRIPSTVTEGRLSYIRLDLVPMMGRIVEVSRRDEDVKNSPQ
jgi:hypothetical protein